MAEEPQRIPFFNRTEANSRDPKPLPVVGTQRLETQCLLYTLNCKHDQVLMNLYSSAWEVEQGLELGFYSFGAHTRTPVSIFMPLENPRIPVRILGTARWSSIVYSDPYIMAFDSHTYANHARQMHPRTARSRYAFIHAQMTTKAR